ncbi:hypothetical protein [Commensalibacter oyaizuii]|uniref:Uncharacterized protein n=1 Tax=Commensalibacter oyaizuii TaxID=3043873 RepID=A0ABT6Q2U7_9PROT|nr:hypothetical protein [Commensalibacter sp. TBRC 16381]MDI2091441.1 hypothetical protein [Commensalibacter sp. TBRC 16381]
MSITIREFLGRAEEKMIEIKGKDGGVLQFEINYLSNVNYTFTYKNDDIFFICKDDDDSSLSLSNFRTSLGGLLKSKPKPSIDEMSNRKPDSWFRQQLKLFFPSWLDETYYNSDNCGFFPFVNIYASLECRRVEDSSDYVFEFEFYDPYFTSNTPDDAMELKGSLVVTRPALWDFHQDLLSL